MKLVKLKENLDELETVKKIRNILAPMEFTRLDRLVDVMFTAATDVEPIIAETPTVEAEGGELSQSSDSRARSTWEFTDAGLLQSKRERIIAAVAVRIGTTLIKKSRALYWSSDRTHRVAATISKRYVRRPLYWYAYHPQWDEFLAEGDGYLILGCMDLSIAFQMPRPEVHSLLADLDTTTTDHGKYWHLKIAESDTIAGQYELLVPRRSSNLNLTRFQFSFV
jgi:hypothetical protein